MRWLIVLVVFLGGCASLEKRTAGDADVAAILAKIDAGLDASKKVSQGDNSKYSSGAGWVALVAGIFGVGSIWQHKRSSNERTKTRAQVDELLRRQRRE